MKDKNILEEKFEEIKKMGWIESKGIGFSGVGKTFEELIAKKEDNFELPDFGNIEIKTQRSDSESYISLFNYAPEGNSVAETKRIYQLYSYRDPKCSEDAPPILNKSVYVNRNSIIGKKYKFSLKIDKNSRKIYLFVFDNYNNLIESDVYWDFNVIKEKLFRKITNLSYIKADRKYINGKEYFKYEEIAFYKLRDFNTFINLLERRYIRISFRIGIFKSGKRKGEIHDHGTRFQLDHESLELLFKKY